MLRDLWLRASADAAFPPTRTKPRSAHARIAVPVHCLAASSYLTPSSIQPPQPPYPPPTPPSPPPTQTNSGASSVTTTNSSSTTVVNNYSTTVVTAPPVVAAPAVVVAAPAPVIASPAFSPFGFGMPVFVPVVPFSGVLALMGGLLVVSLVFAVAQGVLSAESGGGDNSSSKARDWDSL